MGPARKVGRAVRGPAERPAGVRGSRVHRGEGDRPVGPEGERPLGVADAAPVEGEVDNELDGGRSVKRLRCAADGHRAEHRDFDGVVGHDGERSGTPSVGAEGFEPSLGTV